MNKNVLGARGNEQHMWVRKDRLKENNNER